MTPLGQIGTGVEPAERREALDDAEWARITAWAQACSAGRCAYREPTQRERDAELGATGCPGYRGSATGPRGARVFRYAACARHLAWARADRVRRAQQREREARVQGEAVRRKPATPSAWREDA